MSNDTMITVYDEYVKDVIRLVILDQHGVGPCDGAWFVENIFDADDLDTALGAIVDTYGFVPPLKVRDGVASRQGEIQRDNYVCMDYAACNSEPAELIRTIHPTINTCRDDEYDNDPEPITQLTDVLRLMQSGLFRPMTAVEKKDSESSEIAMIYHYPPHDETIMIDGNEQGMRIRVYDDEYGWDVSPVNGSTQIISGAGA